MRIAGKRMGHRLHCLGMGLLLAALPLAGQVPPVFSPISVRVPSPPLPLVGGGRTHLVYELQVINVAPQPATLDAVEVRSATGGEPLLRLAGPALEAAIRRFGEPADDHAKRELPAGRTAVVFLWVTLPPGPVPASLTHQFTIRSATGSAAVQPGSQTPGSGQPMTVTGIEVAVAGVRPRVIAPPLQGDHWFAVNGPDNDADHRRSMLPLAGELHIAQRFAIDWVRLYDDGRTAKGDPLKNASYRCYGASALAVGDGTIIDSHDGIPENVPGAVARAVPITPDTLGGNYVVLDLGDHRYAFYAHLQPNSLKVRKGDHVRRGQVLGLVGNSGNSSEPHLHFHLGDAREWIASEGVPYAFQAFDLEAEPALITPAIIPVGESLGIGAAAITKWLSGPAQTRRMEMPMRNAIVKF